MTTFPVILPSYLIIFITITLISGAAASGSIAVSRTPEASPLSRLITLELGFIFLSTSFTLLSLLVGNSLGSVAALSVLVIGSLDTALLLCLCVALSTRNPRP